MQRRIVLASSSVYRRELLERLGLAFEVDVAGIPEASLPGEAPRDTALRLSLEKAGAVAARHQDAIVIGADQVAECEGTVLGKPGNPERAIEQLLLLRGRRALFHSGVAMFAGPGRRPIVDCITTEVVFRALSREALEAYLRRDQPWDCAGAAKIESLGICLVESVRCDDPTALIGLPLIRLTSMLAEAGVALPLA